MATETERKFLVISDAWRENVVGVTYHQGYLSDDPARTVRIRTAGDKAFITVKGAKSPDGTSCPEYEYPIPHKDAREMLDALCLPGKIEKVRHKVVHEGMTWEVDEFKGENEGLIVAEIELTTAAQVFAKPAWAGAEVTQDARYSNAMLAKNPFRNWKP
jgi:adenylate cyclase